MAIDKTRWNRRIWDQAVLVCFWTMQVLVLLAMIGLFLGLKYLNVGAPISILFPASNGAAILVIVIEVFLYLRSWLTPWLFMATNIIKTTLQLVILVVFILRATLDSNLDVGSSAGVKVVVLQALAFILAFFLILATLVYACIVVHRSRKAKKAIRAITQPESGFQRGTERSGTNGINRSTTHQVSEIPYPNRARIAAGTRNLLRLNRVSTTSSYFTIPEFESSGPPPPIPPPPPVPELPHRSVYELGTTSRTSSPRTSRATQRSRGSRSSRGSDGTRSIRTRIRASEAARDFMAFRLRLESHNHQDQSGDQPPYQGTRPLDPRP